jgi:hypothetical protein
VGRQVERVLLVIILAALALIVIGIIIKGLHVLLVIGPILLLLALIIAMARYLRSGWRR